MNCTRHFMEHGHASIEIWFMMTRWDLDRPSARYVIVLLKPMNNPLGVSPSKGKQGTT